MDPFFLAQHPPHIHSPHYSARRRTYLQSSSSFSSPPPSAPPMILGQSSSTFITTAQNQVYEAGKTERRGVSNWQLKQIGEKESKVVHGYRRHTTTPSIKLWQSMEVTSSGSSTFASKFKGMIRFSYSNALQRSTTSLAPVREIVGRQQANGRQQSKAANNSLRSGQMEFTYSPREKQTRSIQEIRKTNKELEELLFSLMEESNVLTSKTSIHCSRDSKLTDTTIGEPKDSSLLNNISHQTHFGPSLNQYLSSSKNLDKTIILSHNYNFGGLMPSRTSPHKVEVEKEQTSWKDVRGLLSEEQQMKESIHCGPEERGMGYECSMLSGFGRVIKESVISLRE